MQGLDIGGSPGRVLAERLAVDQNLDPADLCLQRLDRDTNRHERYRDDNREEGHGGKLVWVFPFLT